MGRGTEFHRKRIQATYCGEGSGQAYKEAHGDVSPGLVAIVESGRLRRGARVLDVGCGPGIDAKYLLVNGFEVVGVDMSKSMVEEARRVNPGGSFAVADALSLPFAGEHFDAVHANYVLPYLLTDSELRTAVDESNRVLRDGGVLSVGVQEGPSGIRTVNASFGDRRETSVHVMSRRKVVGLLEGGGFSIAEVVERKPNPHQTPFKKLVVYAYK